MTPNSTEERVAPDRIYLAPDCCTDPNEGRIWCEHDVWPLDDCPNNACGIPYVREALTRTDKDVSGLVEALDDALPFIDIVRMRARREGDGELAAEASDAFNLAQTALAKHRQSNGGAA